MINKSIVDAVVIMLQMHNVDGETMEHIINEVGMRDQMIKQLTPQDDIVELERGEDLIIASFTKNTLIEYTREIIERMMNGVEEAIKGSGVDIESHIELNLYGREINIEVDDDSIYSEIVSNVKYDTFFTDDDSIWDEATNVIRDMKSYVGVI